MAGARYWNGWALALRPLLPKLVTREAPRRYGRPKMRILELSLAGVLALTAPIAAHSAPLGLNLGQAMLGPVPGVIQAGDGRGSNWHPAPGGGWQAPFSGQRRFNGGQGPYGGLGVPNYYIWVPGSAIFDDPFPDWRGPTGGWGNP